MRAPSSGGDQTAVMCAVYAFRRGNRFLRRGRLEHRTVTEVVLHEGAPAAVGAVRTALPQTYSRTARAARRRELDLGRADLCGVGQVTAAGQAPYFPDDVHGYPPRRPSRCALLVGVSVRLPDILM